MQCAVVGGMFSVFHRMLTRRLIEQSGRTAAFMVEPIQGEAGVVVPDFDYLDKVSPCPFPFAHCETGRRAPPSRRPVTHTQGVP